MTRLFEAKPFVIAEVGSNWDTLHDCIQSIEQAKDAGADAVKFQAFSYQALYGYGWQTLAGPRELPHSLPLDWLPQLKEKADACGIEFMCTAFSPELVAAVDPFVSVHKVASSDAAWPQMLKAVSRKPVLLSTGAKGEGEIDAAFRILGAITAGGRGIPLFCVAAYPAGFVDFDVMRLIANRYGGRVGFSDHTLGITAAVEAARRGAVVIEKHFTAFPDLDTPDRPHSIGPDEFKRMVDLIRGATQPTIGPSPEERDMLLRHNRRLIVTQETLPDEPLRYGVNYGAFRALYDDTRGLSPFAWELVEGRRATRPLKRGESIGAGDFG